MGIQGFIIKPMEDFTFHSEEIISTIEGLQSDFKTKLSEVKMEETKAVSDFDLQLQAYTDILHSRYYGHSSRQISPRRRPTPPGCGRRPLRWSSRGSSCSAPAISARAAWTPPSYARS